MERKRSTADPDTDADRVSTARRSRWVGADDSGRSERPLHLCKNEFGRKGVNRQLITEAASGYAEQCRALAYVCGDFDNEQ